MPLSRSGWWILSAWLLLVGGYWAVSLFVFPGARLTAFGNIALCIMPLVANAGLLVNAASPYRRTNAFWMLLALGCTLWLLGQLVWTYLVLVLHWPEGPSFLSDVIFFLHTVPWIGALAVQPHARKVGETLRYGYLDLLLMALWWIYLFQFVVLPWRYIVPRESLYVQRYMQIYTVENLVFLICLALLMLRAKGRWRVVYAHLFGAGVLYTAGTVVVSAGLNSGTYYTGSLSDLPQVAAFVWFGTAGLVARQLAPAPDPHSALQRRETRWPAWLAMIGVLSMPVLAVWNSVVSKAPEPVRHFRLLITLGAILLGALLVFLREHLVDQERQRLLQASQESVENLKRLQMQFVQSEKLASLGQLAAGAAHEINNPLTAILGYADLLIDDGLLSAKAHGLAEKIREQARRTKTLVTHLLSFARQVPAEKTLLDINAVVSSAAQLRQLDLHDKDIRIHLPGETVLPAVRGDPNQLLQVFFNIINNAVDAMEEVGGGTLTVRTLRERGKVVIDFSDTGPGIKEPHLVFDPFYTTKPVGKGTGLGLSICYGIVREHGGHITCYNRPEGGATFRVELPAVLPLFPQAPANQSSSVKAS